MQKHLLGTFQIQQLVVLRDDANVSFYHGGTNGDALFHNSGFSNWYPFIFNEASPGQFFVAHEQQTIRVNHAEAILMAVKERIGNGKPLGDCLARHAKLNAKESKQAANLAGAYPL